MSSDYLDSDKSDPKPKDSNKEGQEIIDVDSAPKTTSAKYAGYQPPGKFTANNIRHKKLLSRYYVKDYKDYKYTVICSYCFSGSKGLQGRKFSPKLLKTHLENCVKFRQSKDSIEVI